MKAAHENFSERAKTMKRSANSSIERDEWLADYRQRMQAKVRQRPLPEGELEIQEKFPIPDK